MILLIVAIIAIAVSVADLKAQSIIPYAKNPRYWQFHGNPVMLLGVNLNRTGIVSGPLTSHQELNHSNEIKSIPKWKDLCLPEE